MLPDCDQYHALRNSATKSTYSDISLVCDRNSQLSTSKGRWGSKPKPPNSPKQWHGRAQNNQNQNQNGWYRPQNLNGSPKRYQQQQSQQSQHQHQQQQHG
jgi:hypothetical protein